MDKIIPTGTKAFAFDTETLKPEVVETVVCGSFINIESGDVYYYLPNSKQPAYAVSTSKEALEAKLADFMEYRQLVSKFQSELDARRAALGEINLRKELAGILYPTEPNEESNDEQSV